MRIAIPLQSLDQTWGGIGIYTHQVVENLLKVDRENEYVLVYPGFGPARERMGFFEELPNVTEIQTRSAIPYTDYWEQVIVPWAIRRHGADVLFNPFFSVPLAGRYGKVTVIHSLEFHTVPGVYDFKMRIWWRLREQLFLPAADRVISISKTVTEDMRRFMQLPMERVRTVYHGVSEKFKPITDPFLLNDARERYRLPNRFILFVGFLYPQKNFSLVLRGLHRIAEQVPHRLLVAGGTRWKYTQDLAIMERLGLSDRVQVLGFVPNDHLPSLYSLADCFVYPSLYESFGLAQLEAMACGCPVIGVRSGAIPEVCGEAAILVDPVDPEELADAMLRLLTDPALRETLVKKGLARAREFTWERCATETLDVLKEAYQGQ